MLPATKLLGIPVYVNPYLTKGTVILMQRSSRMYIVTDSMVTINRIIAEECGKLDAQFLRDCGITVEEIV